MATAASDVAVRQWMADFVAETLRGETLEQMVARLDAQIIGRVPELTDRDLRRDLESSTRAHALAVLSGLTQDAMDYAVPEQAHAFARTLARRGYDLRLLLRVYHAGQEAANDYMTEVIDERRLPEQFERSALIRLFERSTRWVNTSVEALTDTYMQERAASRNAGCDSSSRWNASRSTGCERSDPVSGRAQRRFRRRGHRMVGQFRQQRRRCRRHRGHRLVEGRLRDIRQTGQATHLPHVFLCGSKDFLLGGTGFEPAQHGDVAHGAESSPR